MELGECTQKWNFLYIEDMAEVMTVLLERVDLPGGIYNVAGEDTRVLREFVEEIHEIAGGRGTLEYGIFVQAKEGALSVCPDVEKLNRLLEGRWEEAYTFRQGIEETMKREENDRYEKN